jgi:hypothetical protein
MKNLTSLYLVLEGLKLPGALPGLMVPFMGEIRATPKGRQIGLGVSSLRNLSLRNLQAGPIPGSKIPAEA